MARNYRKYSDLEERTAYFQDALNALKVYGKILPPFLLRNISIYLDFLQGYSTGIRGYYFDLAEAYGLSYNEIKYIVYKFNRINV